MDEEKLGAVAEPDREVCSPRAGDAAFYRGIVEGMRCAILTIDPCGRVLSLNRMASDILEVDPVVAADERDVSVGELLGRHERLAEILLDSLEMSHPPNRAELEIATRGGGAKTIGFTISPIRVESGAAGMAIFFKDLTQVERQEERDRLRDRLAALGQMAASLAHEIRNPLASIDVTASLLRRRLNGSAKNVADIDKIRAEVARLNRTVKQGLEFARPIAPERSSQPLAPIVEQALQEARHRFSGSAIVVETVFQEGAPDPFVDGELLRQVFVNLIVNAYEAMGTAGRLTIEITRAGRLAGGPGEGSAVECTISDDGPGLPNDVREKIFYPFVTTKRDGSGIGLAMARKIVECHHGMIDVADRPSRGTIFRVRLPCESGEDVPPRS